MLEVHVGVDPGIIHVGLALVVYDNETKAAVSCDAITVQLFESVEQFKRLRHHLAS